MSPPDIREVPSIAPGVIQARAQGRRVEVRNHEGRLVRIVDEHTAIDLVESGIAVRARHFVRLNVTVDLTNLRTIPTKFSALPDLTKMDPKLYAERWRGTIGARTGKGALGRVTAIRGEATRRP